MAIDNPTHWWQPYHTRGLNYDKILEIIAELNSPTIDHATRHEDGGTDEINVAALSGLLADPQTPLAHKTSHQNGGSDELSVAGLNGLLADPQNPVGHAASHQSAGGDPLIHASAHEPSGGDAMAVDAAVGTGSLRTIGTGAQQAAAGNHGANSHVGGYNEWHYLTPYFFDNIALVGSAVHLLPGSFQLLYANAVDTRYYYAGTTVIVPNGYYGTVVAYQICAWQGNGGSTGFHWGEIKLSLETWNTGTPAATYLDLFVAGGHPLGTTAGIAYYRHNSMAGNNFYSNDDDTTDTLAGLGIRLQVNKHGGSGVIQVYSHAVKITWTKI